MSTFTAQQRQQRGVPVELLLDRPPLLPPPPPFFLRYCIYIFIFFLHFSAEVVRCAQRRLQDAAEPLDLTLARSLPHPLTHSSSLRVRCGNFKKVGTSVALLSACLKVSRARATQHNSNTTATTTKTFARLPSRATLLLEESQRAHRERSVSIFYAMCARLSLPLSRFRSFPLSVSARVSVCLRVCARGAGRLPTGLPEGARARCSVAPRLMSRGISWPPVRNLYIPAVRITVWTRCC